MGNTIWPMRNTDFSFTLRVDEQSTEQEIEDEVEYWMTQLSVYDIQGEDRACILQAIRWMNELGT